MKNEDINHQYDGQSSKKSMVLMALDDHVNHHMSPKRIMKRKTNVIENVILQIIILEY